MNRIITLEQMERDKEEREAHDRELFARYDADECVRKLADKIHKNRMMAGNACPSCIEMAIRQIESEK